MEGGGDELGQHGHGEGGGQVGVAVGEAVLGFELVFDGVLWVGGWVGKRRRRRRVGGEERVGHAVLGFELVFDGVLCGWVDGRMGGWIVGALPLPSSFQALVK